jgi:LDH2 family malate/lactate/ureidoglycolate dehydrogenase
MRRGAAPIANPIQPGRAADMATSAAAGKINVGRGEQVPAGWLIDADGKPSGPRAGAARCCRSAHRGL